MELYRLKNKCAKQFQKTKSITDQENIETPRSVIAAEIEEFHSNNWSKFTKNLGKNILSTLPFWRRQRKSKKDKYIKI